MERRGLSSRINVGSGAGRVIGDEPTHEETDRRRHVQSTAGNQNEGQETPWCGEAATQNPQPDSVEEVEKRFGQEHLGQENRPRQSRRVQRPVSPQLKVELVTHSLFFIFLFQMFLPRILFDARQDRIGFPGAHVMSDFGDGSFEANKSSHQNKIFDVCSARGTAVAALGESEHAAFRAGLPALF